MKVYICFDSTGFMDSQKGAVSAVFLDEVPAREWANQHMCFVEEWEVRIVPFDIPTERLGRGQKMSDICRSCGYRRDSHDGPNGPLPPMCDGFLSKKDAERKYPPTPRHLTDREVFRSPKPKKDAGRNQDQECCLCDLPPHDDSDHTFVPKEKETKQPRRRKRCPGCNKVIRKMDTWCGTCAQYSWATPYMAGGSGETK